MYIDTYTCSTNNEDVSSGEQNIVMEQPNVP